MSPRAEFDRLSRFEAGHELRALPGVFMVLRADGRGFTRLLRRELGLTEPFDERVRDAMLAGARRLFACGLRAVFAYTQSDEVSLLLHRDEEGFDRRLFKLASLAASEVSVAFSAALGVRATFDCRVAQLPRAQDVVDYFDWRMADAARNALSAWTYWTVRQRGGTAQQATAALDGATAADKNERLFQAGINFNALPAWQRRGAGLYYRDVARCAVDPRTQAVMSVQRRALQVDLELPMKDDARRFLAERVEAASGPA